MPLSAIKQRERRDRLRAQGIDPSNIARSLNKKPIKRRRCRNCFAWMVIGKHQNKLFCGKPCRAEFHRFGAAYGPLKAKLEKLIAKTVAVAVTDMRRLLREFEVRLKSLEVGDTK